MLRDRREVCRSDHAGRFERTALSIFTPCSNPIGTGVFTGATVYLGVQVGSDPKMSPRQPLVSVPYALLANNAVRRIR